MSGTPKLAPSVSPGFRRDNMGTGSGGGGAPIWQYATGAVNSSPVSAPDGTVDIGSYDRYVYALNEATRAFNWCYGAAAWVHSSPAIGSSGAVYVGTEDHGVYARNGPTGALIWQYMTGAGVSSSPAIGSDGTLYIGSEDGSICAFEPGGITLVIQ